jgi:hypothetical protein
MQVVYSVSTEIGQVGPLFDDLDTAEASLAYEIMKLTEHNRTGFNAMSAADARQSAEEFYFLEVRDAAGNWTRV